MSFDAHESRAIPSPSVLPRFAKPPVVEVAISVQFEPLTRFQLVDFGLLWERVRERYPDTQHHPPLPPVVELFGTRRPRQNEFRIEQTFPIGRCWYLSGDGRRLLQVQPDRFILNWQKRDAETPYPSYDTLRAEFRHELGMFLTFLEERRLGGFEPTQCELIYVNHLLAGQEWNEPNDLSGVLAPWSGTASDSYPPDVEDLRLAWQYRFDEAGKPLGRLHVDVQPAVRESDSRPVFTLQLTGRGAPGGADVDSVLAFTDRAHEWIVHGFTAITTERMHLLWERQR